MTAAQTIAGFATSLTLDDVPADVVEHAKLHVLDGAGKVSRNSRDRFALFLMGWLGGPQTYSETHGHPRLRMRHGHVPVNLANRDAWQACTASPMG